MSRVDRALSRNAGLAAGPLLASSATLVCCVLPAVLVALGAGAALAGLVTAVPRLVWLSEHKLLVFGNAATLLRVALRSGTGGACRVRQILVRREHAGAYGASARCFTA